MRVAEIFELGSDFSGLRIVERAAPHPGPGELRVAVRAAALNFPDILMAQGLYQLKPDLPFTPGLEGAGEIVELGEGVEGWTVGDRVMLGSRFGMIAEQLVLPANTVRAMPPGFSFAEAAGFTTIALTAYVALVRRAALQAGETLLVHGAAGGVGSAAIMLGKHLGATVIATASSPEKRAFATQIGADHALHSASEFRLAVKELTGGRGADVIFDPVGGDVFDQSVRAIGFDGRLLVIGFAGGRIPELPVNKALIKGFSVMGVRAGEYGRQFPAKGRENMAALDDLAAQGVMKPVIGKSFALDQLHDAYRELSERRALGKVVITMGRD